MFLKMLKLMAIKKRLKKRDHTLNQIDYGQALTQLQI